MVAGSYIFPSLFRQDDLTVIYGVNSDSDTAFGEGFEVLGKGKIFGIRHIFQLSAYLAYNHNVTVGVDYKDFDETLGLGPEGNPVVTPIPYLPLSISYTGSLPDSFGMTQFSGGLNMAFRGLVTDMQEFETKRYLAKGNYLYLTLGLERLQKLPASLTLSVEVDGQISDQPLIANEMYCAGGMQSVRGYAECEETGDNAVHSMIELLMPDLAETFLQLPGKVRKIVPFLFFDYAYLKMIDPLPETDTFFTLSGTGVGLRCNLGDHLTLEGDWAVALSSTDRTERGDKRGNFFLKYEF